MYYVCIGIIFPFLLNAAPHTSQNSLDWKGTYSGIIPGAGPGIEMTVTLDEDSKYTVSRRYMEDDTAVYISSGEFTWLPDGTRIVLPGESGKSDLWFHVGENTLFLLDTQGEKYQRHLGDHPALRKSDSADTIKTTPQHL